MANNGNIDMTKPRQASEYGSNRPPFKDWAPWLYGNKPGDYATDDIEATRHWFLSEGISPRVQYSGSAQRRLTAPSRKQYVFAEPKYAHSLSCWSGELATLGYECPYRGESLASYTHQVVMALVKNKRKKVSKAERDRVLAQYDYKCHACGDLGNTWDNVLQLDHPSPLRDHGDNNQDLVPLCNQCHSHKSYLEALTPFQETHWPLCSSPRRTARSCAPQSPSKPCNSSTCPSRAP